MKRYRFLYILPWMFPLLLLLAACSSRQAVSTETETGSTSPGQIELVDCQLAAAGLAQRLPARCGSLAVYENRQAGTGRQINLNLALIPANSRDPEPDPLFFLAGGPGQAATESYLLLSPAFERIHQKRDIVLVDQRGTGRSNPLQCKDIPDTQDTEEEIDWRALIRACLEDLEADPSLYTTSIAMEDLDQVRAALGYEQINLYGVSYGTRAALTYLRQYPERVRAVILDGVVPQTEILGLNMAPDAQRVLDQLFLRCAAETPCREAFPDLKTDFESLLRELEEEPVQVTIPDPVTSEPVELTFTPEKLASALRLLTYAPETTALLPLLIHHAAETGNFDRLAAQYRLVTQQLDESLSEGMYNSVMCSEDLPFYNLQQAEQAASQTYLRSLSFGETFEICSLWPKGEIPADFKQPVESEAPVLLLSGGLDPVTPPDNAEEAAETLPNSLSLVAAGQGHNVIYRGCLPRIASDFIEGGSTQNLDIACMNKIRPAPFFLNFNGPNP
jgi:pimeloyl-ACP methyl ester carboxylesterase